MKYNGDAKLFAGYIALLTNMFIHNATYSPSAGYGKAQFREYKNKHQLQYYRSKGASPTLFLHTHLTQNPDKKGKCRLPINKGFVDLWKDTSIGKELSKLDDEGYVKAGRRLPSQFYGIAHSGARRNNFSVIATDIENIVKGLDPKAAIDKLVVTLNQAIPVNKQIKTLGSIERTLVIIRNLLTAFKAITPKLEKLPTDIPVQTLSNHLHAYRLKRCEFIQQVINDPERKLNHISIEYHPQATCLFIRLYPNFTCDTAEYNEGVTNVLLSFLAGC